MAPFTPPCLRGVLPPQQVPRSDIYGWNLVGRERGLPRMAPVTPPCLRGVFPPQLLDRLPRTWLPRMRGGACAPSLRVEAPLRGDS